MFKILNPCRKTWAGLKGDDRRRFCDDCGQHVHAVESYSPQEQQALLASREPLCIMDAPAPLARPSRRALFAMSLLASARPLWAETGGLRINVVDATQTGVGQAEIQVHSTDDDGLLARTVGSQTGEAWLKGLPTAKLLRLSVSVPGFKKWSKDITLSSDKDFVVKVELEVGSVGGGAFIEEALTPRPPKRGRRKR